MDPRNKAASILAEMHRRRAIARDFWDGPRAGAETALVYGTLRRRGTLDAVLAAYSSRRLPLLKPDTLAALRVGLCELLYFDDSPPHAVVHAAVDHVKRAGRIKDMPFVNAVLRNILRGRRRGEPGDPRRTVPRTGTAIRFSKTIFPDPERAPDRFLAARCSTAPWIARRRLAELGFERALRCLDLQAATPPTHLRPVDREDVRAALARAGIAAADGPHDLLLTVASDVKISDVFAACGDRVVVQDAVASQVAPFLDPPRGGRVLDYCAAPGGKATHLALLVGPEGHVTAWDTDESRLELVRENAARLGLANLVGERPDGAYDAVLVDAPCSNTGVLARRPEARWRVRERHLPGLAERQLKILKDAAAHARPGGTVVYSTCSLEPEENGGTVERFLDRSSGYRLEEARSLYPDEAAGDGGFMARLRRV